MATGILGGLLDVYCEECGEKGKRGQFSSRIICVMGQGPVRRWFCSQKHHDLEEKRRAEKEELDTAERKKFEEANKDV